MAMHCIPARSLATVHSAQCVSQHRVSAQMRGNALHTCTQLGRCAQCVAQHCVSAQMHGNALHTCTQLGHCAQCAVRITAPRICTDAWQCTAYLHAAWPLCTVRSTAL